MPETKRQPATWAGSHTVERVVRALAEDLHRRGLLTELSEKACSRTTAALAAVLGAPNLDVLERKLRAALAERGPRQHPVPGWLPEGHPVPFNDLKPYEVQQGGYWLYLRGEDAERAGAVREYEGASEPRVWVPATACAATAPSGVVPAPGQDGGS